MSNKDNKRGSKLGVADNNYWLANSKEVNLDPPPPPQELIKFQTESQTVTIDIRKTCLIVVDMQNEWCSKGGWWTDHPDRDYSYATKLIHPIKKLIPQARARGIKILWLNWGLRKDTAEVPPNTFWSFNPDGKGKRGIGLQMEYGKFLEKGSWGADIIDELKVVKESEDLAVDVCRYSGFWNTDLDTILRNYGIRNLIFTGVCTDQCVHHTIADANFLGYGCILLRDCVGTNSPDFVAKASLWQMNASFGFITFFRQ